MYLHMVTCNQHFMRLCANLTLTPPPPKPTFIIFTQADLFLMCSLVCMEHTAPESSTGIMTPVSIYVTKPFKIYTTQAAPPPP